MFYYDLNYLDISALNDKTYIIPAYDLSYNYPYHEFNWEDLTRVPLTYIDDYRVQINKSKK